MLREAGFLKAFRGQQYCGAAGNADVVCPELPSFHFEVKGVQNLNVLNAMKQAIADCPPQSNDGKKQTPVVAHKKNGEPWLVTMLAADWLELVKETDRVTRPTDDQSAPESLPTPPSVCSVSLSTADLLTPTRSTHRPAAEHR